MTQSVFLFLAAFLASAVEMVEALTIVLAVGVTRGWRSTLLGVAAALVALAVLVLALGPSISSVPINDLRLVVGFPPGGGVDRPVAQVASVEVVRS